MSHTVAIMQPYFFPYAGYFRLLEQSDHFVIYDCVQFPRRGYVHRNMLPSKADGTGEASWLSLPLLKQSRGIKIMDLKFSDQAATEWPQRLNAPAILRGLGDRDPELDATLRAISARGNVCDYLIETLKLTCARLGFMPKISRSSELALPEDLTGQNRILQIAQHHNATTYLNAPGGRSLYDPKKFMQMGIDLQFLPDFTGSKHSILFDLAKQSLSES